MIEVKGFRCSHCDAAGRVRRTYATTQSCQKHERACYLNPTNLACATCRHWVSCHLNGKTTHACAIGKDRGPTAQMEPKPIMGCGYWESKR